MTKILYRLTYPLSQTHATWPAYLLLEFVALILFDGEGSKISENLISFFYLYVRAYSAA
jgi:hypothetical protein